MSRVGIEIPHPDVPWGTCRWCGKPILKPDGTQNVRRRWHQPCVDEFNWQSSETVARYWIEAREKGMCQACGFDTAKLETELMAMSWSRSRDEAANLGFSGFRTTRWALWDMDHVVPICLGGKHEKANLWTLCMPCHKAKTAEERKNPPEILDPEAAKDHWRQYLADRREP